MRSKTRLIWWALIAVGALSALWIGYRRGQVEADNRRVQIVLDWDEVRSLADETGTPIGDLLDDFYRAGARGVAIGEETISEMQTLRRAEILPPEEVSRPAAAGSVAAPSEMLTRLRVPEPALRGRILNTLRNKWDVTVYPDDDVLAIPAAWADVGGLSIGFPSDVVSFVRVHHMEPVLRITNFLGAGNDTVSWTADRIEAAGGRLVIFGGDQVLGFPDGLKETATAFGGRDLVYGQVEFGKQKGEEALARLLRGNIVRVHSINPVEMARLTESAAVDRFLLAAEERNIRVLYVRLLPGAQNPPVAENVGYVNDIARSLRSRGFQMSLARPFTPYESSIAARSLVGLGVGAATLLLVTYVWPVSGTALLLLLLLAAADAALPMLSIGRRLVALQGAIVMPVLAFAWLREAMERRYGKADGTVPDDPDVRPALWRSVASRGTLRLFLTVTLISLLGGLFVVGLLSSRLATVKITAFAGVKAQQAVALLMIAAMYFLDIDARGGLAHARARVTRRVHDLWNRPMLLGTLVVALAVIVALMMLLARSGNDPGVGVSPIELRFRAVLDQILGVRPRTKEFLIGHPALLLGIALVALRRVRFALPLLIVGAIGQVGLVNTFSHLHTPLAVSLVRTAHGVWLGILVAAVVAAVADRIRARTVRR